MFSVVLDKETMSKLQACADWSRPSPSSPRLPGLGSVQSDLTVGPDRTEPYPRPGPSGLVESLLSGIPYMDAISTGWVLAVIAAVPDHCLLHSHALAVRRGFVFF
jgi:hypothetical protein